MSLLLRLVLLVRRVTGWRIREHFLGGSAFDNTEKVAVDQHYPRRWTPLISIMGRPNMLSKEMDNSDFKVKQVD